MLTVFLLVVLGGGAALLAVWSVHPGSRPRLAGRPGPRSLRAPGPAGTARDPAATDIRSEAPRRPAAGGSASKDESAPVLEVVEAPTAPERVGVAVDAIPPPGPPLRRRRGGVPAAFTAVEGSYRDVAVVPVWRKALSLAMLLAVLFGTGIGLAAVTAAGLGLAAELVDSAIG